MIDGSPPETLAMMLRLLSTGFAVYASAVMAAARAESPLVTNATPMQPGVNQGSADSFRGDHIWYFFVQPGAFRLTVQMLGMSGDSALAGTIGTAITLVPTSPHSHFTAAKTANGTVYSGTVDQPTKVYILIEPPHSSLVRSARNYVLEATGQVSFGGGGAGGDPIVGTYISKRNDYGATKFMADGRVVTSSDAVGRWALFDAGTQLYNIRIGGDRLAVKLLPGRGLIEPSNDYVIFETAG